MAESLNLRWRILQEGGILNVAQYLNMTKVRHFMERGGKVVR
jgi:hypothetical protein